MSFRIQYLAMLPFGNMMLPPVNMLPLPQWPADREAIYGCLLLIAALTSPCWLPAVIGIAWHVYHVLMDRVLY